MVESATPEEFRRQAKPLSAEELRVSENSDAFVGSPEEAVQVANEKQIRFPISVIPQGENDDTADYHVVNDVEELEDAVKDIQKGIPHGKVHMVSQYPKKLESGRRKSEANIK